jgi:hypothetical protein
MPAKKNPVKTRKIKMLSIPFPLHVMPKLNPAANSAQTKNTLEGENLSAILSMAKKSVPTINPNCTAEVK